MVFKGTASRSATAISEDIENVGGQTNAYTSREFTAFYAKMLKDDLELAVDVLCELVTSPQFAEDELVKEREVVVQEIKQTYDDPGDIVFDYMQAEAFAGQAMGRPILGTAGQELRRRGAACLHENQLCGGKHGFLRGRQC